MGYVITKYNGAVKVEDSTNSVLFYVKSFDKVMLRGSDRIKIESSDGKEHQIPYSQVTSVAGDTSFASASECMAAIVSLFNVNQAMYRLFIPPTAVGANQVLFDFFNATGSGKTAKIISVTPLVDGSVAVTGVVAVNFYLTRTSAVGTTGTAATADGTDLAAATISKMNPANAALPAQVTARLLPGGGATAGALISFASVFSEETSAGSYAAQQVDILSRGRHDLQTLTVPENTGLRIVQGSVASVGNIGFEVIFSLE
jgi:hypothetical protein